METRFHAVASFFVAVSVFGVTGSAVASVCGFLVGVLIDIDHIIMACYKHRTVAPVTLAVRKAISFSLPEIFEVYPIYGVARIITVHLLVGVIITVGGFVIEPTVGVAIGASISVHIVMDVYDGREHLPIV